MTGRPAGGLLCDSRRPYTAARVLLMGAVPHDDRVACAVGRQCGAVRDIGERDRRSSGTDRDRLAETGGLVDHQRRHQLGARAREAHRPEHAARGDEASQDPGRSRGRGLSRLPHHQGLPGGDTATWEK